MTPREISALIDESPMNRGMCGTSWVKNPCNRAVILNGNVMLFEQRGEIVEFHWLKTATKARQLINDSREALRRIFADTGAQLIFGAVPDERRDSKLMARWVGFRFFARHWTPFGEVEVFVITPEFLEG